MRAAPVLAALASLALASLAATDAARAADGIDGRWRAPVDHAEVDIASCGAAKCGTLVDGRHIQHDANATDENNKDASLRGRPLKGLKMLYGFTGGPTVWKGGKVYNPADGGVYSGTITQADADHLKLRGCIIYPLCQTQTWTRIP